MTQQINRSFPFKYSQNHSRTGDVIVVGDPYSHTDHLVVPAKKEFDTTRAQAKKTLAVTEATQARAVADTYQDALSLAEQPGNTEFPYVNSPADNQAQTIYQVVNMVARCVLDLSKQQEPLPEPIGNKG